MDVLCQQPHHGQGVDSFPPGADIFGTNRFSLLSQASVWVLICMADELCRSILVVPLNYKST